MRRLLFARLALRQIQRSARFSVGFSLNLGLGLAGVLLLGAFQSSTDATFRQRSRLLMGADLSVSTRRPLTAQEERFLKDELPARSRITDSIATYSMVAHPSGGSRLAEVVGVEEAYPFYGEIALESGRVIGSGHARPELLEAPGAWISRDLSVQLNVKVGDWLKIGRKSFRVTEVIDHESGSSWRGFSIAPRLYVGLGELRSTGLLARGSTAFYERLIQLPLPPDELRQIVHRLDLKLDDPGVRIRTHEQAAEENATVLSYLNDFMGLVSVVGLLLACLGSGYLYRSFLARRLREIATLISLGLTHRQAIAVELLQVTFLSLASFVLGSAGALLALPMASRALESHLSFAITPAFATPHALFGVLIGVSGSVLTCLPLLLRIRSLKPGLVFNEGDSRAPATGPTPNYGSQLGAWLPACAFFLAICVWQAHSWRIGALFFAGLLLCLLALGGLAVLLLFLLNRLRGSPNLSPLARRPALRIALGSLTGHWPATLAAFLSVGIGTLLITLLPQIQQGLVAELKQPQGLEIPSLFLFDIQQEQLPALESLLFKEGRHLDQPSSLIRARLSRVNGKDFQKSQATQAMITREEQQEARTRNRGYNLTDRATPNPSETLVQGRPFSGPWRGDAPGSNAPEVSLEYRFAERLGLKLGDLLTFDIEGLPVTGKVISLRKIRWTSFQPNFFIQFQPGALGGAPKTYLASIGRLAPGERNRIQSRIVGEFPNISIIDVAVVTQRLLDLFKQLSLALRSMAMISVFTGMIVLFSIATHEARTRRAEIQLLKVLGGRRLLVQGIFLVEFGGLGLTAALSGVIGSTALSYALSRWLFDSTWLFEWRIAASTLAAIFLLTLLTTQGAVLGAAREKPRSLLS